MAMIIIVFLFNSTTHTSIMNPHMWGEGYVVGV